MLGDMQPKGSREGDGEAGAWGHQRRLLQVAGLLGWVGYSSDQSGGKMVELGHMGSDCSLLGGVGMELGGGHSDKTLREV